MRVRAVFAAQIDDGDDVQHADARMSTPVNANVKPAEHLLGPGDKGVSETLRLTDQRKDAAAVVGIRMHVEQSTTAGRKRATDRVKRVLILALAYVGNCFEQRRAGFRTLLDGGLRVSQGVPLDASGKRGSYC